jgi:hypothetical protein
VQPKNPAATPAFTEAVAAVRARVQVDAIAVARGSRCRQHWRDWQRLIQSSHPPQNIVQLFALELQLRVVRDVLILAAAAELVVAAEGQGALRRGLQNFLQFSEITLFLPGSHARAHALARHDERDKHNAAVRAADTVAAEGKIVNRQLDYSSRMHNSIIIIESGIWRAARHE